MLSIDVKAYHMKTYSTGPITTEEEGLGYLNQVKDCFIDKNKLGFFVVVTNDNDPQKRVGLSNPTTNYGWCYYFSDKENGDPIFCLHTPIHTDIKKRYQRLILEACSSDGAEWYPMFNPVSSYYFLPTADGGAPNNHNRGAVFAVKEQPCAINFYISTEDGSYKDYYLDMHNVDIVIQDIKFIDGRRFILFKSINNITKEWIGSHNWGGLFFTDISFKNNLIRDWIILSKSFSSPYNREYQQHIVNKDLSNGTSNFINLQKIVGVSPDTGSSLNPFSSSSATGGLIPGIRGEKDYLIKQNFYIGDEAYIPNIYRYSNIKSMKISDDKKNLILTNKGKMGDYITIKNNNYLIFYNGFLCPEDLIGYDISKIHSGCYETVLPSNNSDPFKTVNTESLLILI